ncbi:MAG: glycosyltransferase family 4 protein [Clostridiaceae bacterium]|nr:glycosyltransferase family 4 protein [Clostridiaceae bacterium]
MIIISDCLTSKPDEGCLKVATSLAIRLKEAFPETMILTCGSKQHFSGHYIRLNKLFVNRQLFHILNKTAGSVLYIPFASNTTASAMRAFVLSVFSHKKISVLFALQHPMNRFARILLRTSKVSVIALAKDSQTYFQSLLGTRAFYLKTGVDTDQFRPVTRDQKNALKERYGIPADMKVVLHVGHLKTGRNLDILQTVDAKYFILIVVSSLTSKNADLRARLEKRPHTRIIDTYVANIQEIYQLADVYIFPVMASGNCIDSPLSVLEAAACNLPIVTTPYGEVKELIHGAGYYPLHACSVPEVASSLEAAMGSQNVHTRETVLDYDWKKSVTRLESMVE